jgi:hypothetical protein
MERQCALSFSNRAMDGEGSMVSRSCIQLICEMRSMYRKDRLPNALRNDFRRYIRNVDDPCAYGRQAAGPFACPHKSGEDDALSFGG